MEAEKGARSLHRLGITPTLLRRAWYYALKGKGRHYIEHKHYDNVLVSPLYDWSTVEGVGRGGLKVTFCRGSEKIRYVELGVEAIGAGGDAIVTVM